MIKLPFFGWMLVLIMLSGVFLGGKLVMLDIYSWGIYPVRLSAGIGISLMCLVCLAGIYKRKVIAKLLAIAVMIISATVITGVSLFLLVVSQREPDILELVRNGLIASLFLFTFSVIFILSKKLKKYFNHDRSSL